MDNGPESAMAGLRSLDQEGITPTAFTLREPSLDDVFLALTGQPDRSGCRGHRRRNRIEDAGDAVVGPPEEAMPIATGELS